MFKKRNLFSRLILALVWVTPLLTSCANQSAQEQPLQLSSQYYNYIQSSFSEYEKQSHDWLTAHRNYITDDQQKELSMNMPFQLSPSQPTKRAILLAHGLGDSPFTFADLSRDLVSMNFHVEVVLLPGHGSKPEDLMLPDYQDWQSLVDHYVELLKQEYDEVWLGGFSTGANLVTTHAIEKGGIDGLLLFSPGFQSKAGSLEKLTPILAGLFDWGWRAEETNAAKYSSSPLNAALAYTRSAQHVRKLLAQHFVEIPTLIVMSEADSVVNPEAVKNLFVERFTHSESRMIWYGEEEHDDARIIAKSMDIPVLRISSASHMGILFKPCNSFYGLNGEIRICENGFSRSNKTRCEQDERVWYGAWGHQEDERIYARLTWNPHYADMLRQMKAVTQTSVNL